MTIFASLTLSDVWMFEDCDSQWDRERVQPSFLTPLNMNRLWLCLQHQSLLSKWPHISLLPTVHPSCMSLMLDKPHTLKTWMCLRLFRTVSVSFSFVYLTFCTPQALSALFLVFCVIQFPTYDPAVGRFTSSVGCLHSAPQSYNRGHPPVTMLTV